MAQFTYIDIKKGRIVCTGDTLMLYHKEYVVSKDDVGYYLRTDYGGNDWIFEYLNIKDKYDFCESTSERGIFPYVKTLTDLTRVIQKLWEYNPICDGDKIKVRDINESSDEYGVCVTGSMAELSGQYIQSNEQYFDEFEQNTKSGVYTGILANGYYWSLDILDLKTIKKASIDTINQPVKPLEFRPVSMKTDYPLTKGECVSATGLILPKKRKNLKITL